MRHSYFGKKLSRTKNERRRLFMGLLRDLINHGEISTTLAKAKAVQPQIEKLITKAKKDNENNRRLVFAKLSDKFSVEKLFDRAKNQFSDRSSGHTQIIKSGFRRGDNADLVILKFVAEEIKPEKISTITKKAKDSKPLKNEKKEEVKTSKIKSKK